MIRMRSFSLASAAVALVAAGGCTQAGFMKSRAEDLRAEIAQLRAENAATYAPREFATAEANLEFFDEEWEERDYWEAENALAVARENAKRAAEITRLDSDQDRDGIPDIDDLCPDSAEIFNGVLDEDGCPDAAGGVVPGARLAISDSVLFQLGSAVLLDSSKAALDTVADEMRANRALSLEVAGHTDSLGPAQLNLDLSKRRAAAVRDYLVSAGIDAVRIIAVGYGEDRPVASNDTAEGRTQNRRVDLVLR